VTVVVRLARADEQRAALAVWRRANRGSALQQHPQRLQRWAREEGARFYVAAEGERLVGMALSLRGRADDGAGEVIPGVRHLTGVAVVPERQRMGIGRRLIATVLADAEHDRCQKVTLWTNETNTAALALFESLGFRPTGRRARDESGAQSVHFERLKGLE
jgi:ribosomal protein S18 acetylase RimI-like enzyme